MRTTLRAQLLVVAGLAALLAGASAARAGCTVDAAGGVAFGSYNPFDASPLDSAGTITINCTSPFSSPVLVKISKGSSSTFTPRTLTSGTHHLDFNLFLDAARTTIWGDGTDGTSYSSQTPADGVNLDLTVFGRIPAGQTSVFVGNYSETLVVTVEF